MDILCIETNALSFKSQVITFAFKRERETERLQYAVIRFAIWQFLSRQTIWKKSVMHNNLEDN
jgi:hypothetical protein